LKTFVRIVLSSVVSLVVGIGSAIALGGAYHAVGWKPAGAGRPQAGLGEAIVVSFIVLITPLVGAVGGAVRRPLIGAFVGVVTTGLFSVWQATNGEWTVTATFLASHALVVWTAGGAAGGALGRAIFPSAAIESQGKLLSHGRG
jgi:hypothetical protein